MRSREEVDVVVRLHIFKVTTRLSQILDEVEFFADVESAAYGRYDTAFNNGQITAKEYKKYAPASPKPSDGPVFPSVAFDSSSFGKKNFFGGKKGKVVYYTAQAYENTVLGKDGHAWPYNALAFVGQSGTSTSFLCILFRYPFLSFLSDGPCFLFLVCPFPFSSLPPFPQLLRFFSRSSLTFVQTRYSTLAVVPPPQARQKSGGRLAVRRR